MSNVVQNQKTNDLGAKTRAFWAKFHSAKNNVKVEISHPEATYAKNADGSYSGTMIDKIEKKQFQTDKVRSNYIDSQKTKNRQTGSLRGANVSEGIMPATTANGNGQLYSKVTITQVPVEATPAKPEFKPFRQNVEFKQSYAPAASKAPSLENRVAMKYNSDYAYYGGTFAQIDSKVDFVKDGESFNAYMARRDSDKAITTYHKLNEIAGRDIAKDARNQSALAGNKTGLFTYDDVFQPLKGVDLSKVSNEQYVSIANKVLSNYKESSDVIGAGAMAKVALKSNGYRLHDLANKGPITSVSQANLVYQSIEKVLAHGKKVKANDYKGGIAAASIIITLGAPHVNFGKYSNDGITAPTSTGTGSSGTSTFTGGTGLYTK